jgi:PAS domain S-box-containing protein
MKETSDKSLKRDNSKKKSNGSEEKKDFQEELETIKKELEALRSRFNSLFEKTNDAIILMDLETKKYQLANQKAAELFGFKLEDINKYSADSFVFEDESTDSLEKLEELKKGKILPIYVRKFKKITGEIFFGEVNLSLVEDPITKRTLIQSIIRDITTRKRAEQNLERDRLIFQKIANVAIQTTDVPEFCNRVLSDLIDHLDFDIGTLRIYDKETDILTLLAVLGLPPERISDLRPMKLTDEQYIISQAIITKKPLFAPDVSKTPELKKYKSRLELFEIKALISWPILDKNKNILGALQLSARNPRIIPEEDRVLFESITDMLANALERLNAEKALEKAFHEREELDRTINLSPAIVFLWKNKEGWPVEFVSDNIAHYGYKPDDFYSEKLLFAEIVHPDDLQRIIDDEKEYLKDSNCNEYVMEYRILTKNGEIRWIYNYNAVRRDLEGNVTHFQGIILDTTESKIAEESLRNERRVFQIIADAAATATTVPELCQWILNGLIDAIDFDIGSVRLYKEEDKLLEPIANVHVENATGREVQSIPIDSPEYINALVARTKTAIFAPDIEKHEIAQTYIERLKKINVRAIITWPLLDVKGDLLGILQLAAFKPKEIPEEDRIVFETISGTLTNAIERLIADEARRDSEEKYRTLVETMNEGIVIFDQNNKMTFVNTSIQNTLGYSSDEVIGESVDKFLPEESKIIFKEKILERRKGKSDVYEIKVRKKDGSFVDVIISAIPLLDDNGEYIGAFSVITDITEQKQVQLVLNRERTILELISEATANNLYVKDLCTQLLEGIIKILELESGTIHFYNKEEKMLLLYAHHGITQDEEYMTTPFSIDNEKHPIARFTRNRMKIFVLDAQNDDFLKNFSLVKKHQYQVYISWPILNASNELLGMLQLGSRKITNLSEKDKTFFDTITTIIGISIEHLQVLEDLKYSQDRYKNTVDTLFDGIIVIENFKIVYANERALEIYGYPGEEYLKIQGFLDLVLDSEKEKYMKVVEKMLAEQESMSEQDYWITRRDGTKRYVRNRVYTRYVDGIPLNMYIATSDLTKRKIAEDSLIRERLVFKLVAEIALFSRDLTELNEKMIRSLMDLYEFDIGSIRLFDKATNKLILSSGFGLTDLLGEEPQPVDISDKGFLISKVARDKKSFFISDIEKSELEEVLLNRTRKLKIKSLVAFPIISDNDELIGTLSLASHKTKEIPQEDVIFFESVTRLLATAIRRTQAEHDLRDLNEELEFRVQQRTAQLVSMNKELEAFSYSVSHDLRTPLRSIDGFSQALLEDFSDQLDETGKDYLTRVRSACTRMSDLIDDILSLSRLTRKDMDLREINLSKLANDILSEFQENEPDRKVTVRVEKNIKILGDSTLVRTIMENLLGNAWKFTSKKSKARIDFGKKIINNEEVYFVQDDGVGFDKTYEDKLFAVFQRLHTYTEFKGTGIGLAIVQRIVNRHGGRVWAESKLGKGATFYFILPVQLTDEERKM